MHRHFLIVGGFSHIYYLPISMPTFISFGEEYVHINTYINTYRLFLIDALFHLCTMDTIYEEIKFLIDILIFATTTTIIMAQKEE